MRISFKPFHSLVLMFGLFSLVCLMACQKSLSDESASHPNVIHIYCDDLGYGNLAVYGSEMHRTPHLDKMAEEGVRFTDFYVTSGVCTPSRSSLAYRLLSQAR